jgi:hypothetical protein
VGFDGSGYATLIDDLFDPKDVAVDPVQQQLYWVNQEGVHQTNLDGSGQVRIVDISIRPAVYDVAVDPLGGWVYWSSYERPGDPPAQIQRSRFDGTDVETLMQGLDAEHYLPIALDPLDAKLYWFDRSTSRIRRANLDASEPEDFLQLTTESVTRMAILHGTGSGHDCNNNGVLDDCDIRDGTSLDDDGDGVPDECFVDCNSNGVDDERDILDGTSVDCDVNWIPDECEIDCNSNGVLDACDIRDGVSEDCQPDGTPRCGRRERHSGRHSR